MTSMKVLKVQTLSTDVWVSMGEPDEVWEKRIKLLEPYRVTKEMMEKLVTTCHL